MNRKRRISYAEAFFNCNKYLSPAAQKAITAQVDQLSTADSQKLQALLLRPAVWKRAFQITTTTLSLALSRFAMRPGLMALVDVQCYQLAHGTFLTAQGQSFIESWMDLMRDPAATGQAVRNIQKHEQRLLGVAWWDLFLCFRELKMVNDPGPPLADVFKLYVLHGPQITTDNLLMGRLMRYEDFRFLLQKSSLGCGSSQTLDEKIESMCEKHVGKPWSVPDGLRGLQFHAREMWATFSRSLDGTDPFEGLRRKRASYIACLLGLDPKPKPVGGWLRMRYLLPRGLPAHFPTVADAYAAGFDSSYQFLPAGPKAPHGETLPCPDRRNCSGLPECVHEPVRAETLIGPMEKLA